MVFLICWLKRGLLDFIVYPFLLLDYLVAFVLENVIKLFLVLILLSVSDLVDAVILIFPFLIEGYQNIKYGRIY